MKQTPHPGIMPQQPDSSGTINIAGLPLKHSRLDQIGNRYNSIYEDALRHVESIEGALGRLSGAAFMFDKMDPLPPSSILDKFEYQNQLLSVLSDRLADIANHLNEIA
jgi:hypothetical protein